MQFPRGDFSGAAMPARRRHPFLQMRAAATRTQHRRYRSPGVGTFSSCFNRAGTLVNASSASNSRIGYTVGFGSEFALTRQWSTKAEYAYMDFGDKNVVASEGTLVNLGLKVSQYKVGLNYRFNAY